MKIDTEKLRTVTNFSKERGISRMHIYRLVKAGEITMIAIDGVNFIFLDEKTESFERKRAPKQ